MTEYILLRARSKLSPARCSKGKSAKLLLGPVVKGSWSVLVWSPLSLTAFVTASSGRVSRGKPPTTSTSPCLLSVLDEPSDGAAVDPVSKFPSLLGRSDIKAFILARSSCSFKVASVAFHLASCLASRSLTAESTTYLPLSFGLLHGAALIACVQDTSCGLPSVPVITAIVDGLLADIIAGRS